MAKNSERTVLFFRLKLLVLYKAVMGLKAFPAYLMFSEIENIFKTGRALKISRDGQKTIYVSDMKVSNSHATILVNISDKSASDPVFSDVPAKTRKIVKKEITEGLDYSCHVVVSFKSTGVDMCSLTMEQMPGLPSVKVENFINKLLRLAAKNSSSFLIIDPNNTLDKSKLPVKKKARPAVEFQGHPSAEFINDLTGGTLSSLELYTEVRSGTPWDSNAYVVEEKSSIFMKPSKTKHVPRAKAIIDAAISATKLKGNNNKFEKAKIVFTTKSGTSKSASIYTDDYGLVNDAKYIKKELLSNFSYKLPTSFKEIDTEIESKIKVVMN